MRLFDRVKFRRNRSEPEPTSPVSPASVVSPRDDPESRARRRVISEYDAILSEEPVDLKKLRQKAWNGIPRSKRKIVWMLLLGHLPPSHRVRADFLRKRREDFEECLRKNYDEVPQEKWSKYLKETHKQIVKDIPRTCPGVPLFTQECIREMMTRVLLAWGVRHPRSGYVQGMNDLLAVIVLIWVADAAGVFTSKSSSYAYAGGRPRTAYSGGSYYYDTNNHIANLMRKTSTAPESADDEEKDPNKDALLLRGDATHLSEETLKDIAAESYHCLEKILEEIQDHYVELQPGLQRASDQVQNLLRRVDLDLGRHLEEQGVLTLQVTFRWINCLLVRELPIPALVRLWDACIAEEKGFLKFFPYICAAFLCHFSDTLRSLGEEKLHLFLQNLPTHDWKIQEVDTLLSEAYILNTLFQDAPSHLGGGEAKAKAAATKQQQQLQDADGDDETAAPTTGSSDDAAEGGNDDRGTTSGSNSPARRPNSLPVTAGSSKTKGASYPRIAALASSTSDD